MGCEIQIRAAFCCCHVVGVILYDMFINLFPAEWFHFVDGKKSHMFLFWATESTSFDNKGSPGARCLQEVVRGEGDEGVSGKSGRRD